MIPTLLHPGVFFIRIYDKQGSKAAKAQMVPWRERIRKQNTLWWSEKQKKSHREDIK